MTNKIDEKAELFAISVYEYMLPKLIPTDTRKKIYDFVEVEVRTRDIYKDYADDGMRMVSYITDSLCSAMGVE